MPTIRFLSVLTSAFALASVSGCSRDGTKKLQLLLDRISHSPESELPALLYGYNESPARVRQVLPGMLRPLRAPSPEQHMSVEAVRQSGRFTMIVARVPWPLSVKAGGLHPIMVTGAPGREKVVGYLLPFNDIFPLMQGTDMRDVNELSQWWVKEYAQKNGKAF
jgi:hypothetical protein